MPAVLSPALVDAVLARLGFASRPDVDADGLGATYRAWCRRVPFDNLRKRIHLAGADPGPLPGDQPAEFFAAWLRHGTGGTCWPSSRALHALLVALGFHARLASAAMFDNLFGPQHTHGTCIVRTDSREFWVDTSMLTDRVIPLARGAPTVVDDSLHPVRVEPVGNLWRVWWEGTNSHDPIPCLLLDDDVDGAHYSARYERSREHSPFNTTLTTNRNVDGARLAIRSGLSIVRTATGI